MAKKIEITKDGYLNLINQIYESKLEEREMALDRYRLADEQMETAEQFVLMGKHAVSFLTLAANSSTDIAALAKEIKSIVYKDGEMGDATINLSDDFKNAISDQIDEADKEKRRKQNSKDKD